MEFTSSIFEATIRAISSRMIGSNPLKRNYSQSIEPNLNIETVLQSNLIEHPVDVDFTSSTVEISDQIRSNSFKRSISESYASNINNDTVVQSHFIEHDPVISKLSMLYSACYCDKTAVSCTVKIGKREVSLYAFHFALDSHAYESKNPMSKLLSYIENDERQVLRKWTIKASLIVSISKHVSCYMKYYLFIQL
jgi:hypothetical protein